VSSFLDAFTGDHILAEEFARLRQRQLRRIYLGVESGDPHLLAWLNKPSTPERMLRVVENAKEGGVQVGVIILIGAGGEPYFQSHARRTLELLNAMRLGRGDYVYLSPLVDMPGTPYHREAALAEIQPLSSARMAEQTRILREGLAFSSEDRPYVAEYDVSRFIY
jgi:radical SAM superfamily enzyme YgiQ (UPF0313 family)